MAGTATSAPSDDAGTGTGGGAEGVVVGVSTGVGTAGVVATALGRVLSRCQTYASTASPPTTTTATKMINARASRRDREAVFVTTDELWHRPDVTAPCAVLRSGSRACPR